MQRSASQSSRVGSRQAVAGLGNQSTASPFTEPIGPAGDVFEREADRMAEAVVRGSLLPSAGAGWAVASGADDTIQRKCAECEEKEQEQIRRAPRGPAAPEADVPSKSAAPAESPSPLAAAAEPAAAVGPAAAPDVGEQESLQTEPAPSLLVEDDMDVSRGQMRKSEFLATLRADVCAAVDDALSGIGRDSDGCPWIDHWFGYYEGRSSAQVERSLRRYAPEGRNATAAADYIPMVTARIQRSAKIFATTGEISGVPEDVPTGAMAGGDVLGAFGGMFFKARPGGARDSNPQSVRAQLGRGESLPGSVRTRMESAFGASFSQVRLHNDAMSARLSDRLNARAFTVGQHIAFGSSEFKPGTVAGDALIAHELAHVVQQGSSQAEGSLHKGGGPDHALERDADGAATGAITALWSPGQTRASEAGRRALPRLRSGLQLQRCGSSQKKVEGQKGGKPAKLTVREERASAISDASERLRDVNKWATAQVKAQGVPSVSGVTNLDSDQAKNVATAIERLQQAQSLFGSKELDALPPKLDDVRNYAHEAYKYGGSTDQEHVLLGRRALGQAVNAADEAAALVSKLGRVFDIPKISANVDDIVTTLNAVQDGKQSIIDAFDVVGKKVKVSKNEIRDLRSRFETTPKAITRIIFLLKNFLVLNKPELTIPPTADEIKRFTGNLGAGLGADFDEVFGGGKATMGFDVFLAYGRVLEQQLKIREQLAKEGVKADSPIPSRRNAEDLFKALKSKPNDEVFAAYISYAQAYFYHRVVDKFQDMQVTDIGAFYKRDISILGTRPLVCTGYALLGSHLLRLAGAKLITFIVAIRATDANLLSANIDAGHAVARMTRNGKEFFVSNDLIVFSVDDAIGEDAVAWANNKAPRFDGFAKTIPAANDAAWKKMEAKTKALRRPKKK